MKASNTAKTFSVRIDCIPFHSEKSDPYALCHSHVIHKLRPFIVCSFSSMIKSTILPRFSRNKIIQPFKQSKASQLASPEQWLADTHGFTFWCFIIVYYTENLLCVVCAYNRTTYCVCSFSTLHPHSQVVLCSFFLCHNRLQVSLYKLHCIKYSEFHDNENKTMIICSYCYYHMELLCCL